MISLQAGPLLLAFLIVIVEMTEVVALVFALSADAESARHGSLGAIAGTAVVGLIALGFGAVLVRAPHEWLLAGSAIVLIGFTVFLFRSTLKSYRRARAAASGPSPAPPHPALLFAGGFTVGATEATEAVVVLISLAAGGAATEAILGAVVAGVVLVVVAAVVHDRIRKIKVPLLKLGASGLVFAFAVLWTGEAAGISWPAGDLFLVPLFVLGVVLVRGLVALLLREWLPVDAKG